MKLSTIISTINKIFKQNNIENIARRTGFMKRYSKIPIDAFTKAITISALGESFISYEVIASKLNRLCNGLCVSKQSIKNRFKNSTAFLHSLLNEIVEAIYYNAFFKPCHHILNSFDDVKIIDSTTISLPNNLKDYYKGMGGRNSVSALKLQSVYSLSKNTIDVIDITQGVQNDKNYAANSDLLINPNEILICDLGYYNSQFFKKLSQEAFFISRVKVNTKFYQMDQASNFHQIDMFELLNQTDEIDTTVYINVGKKEKLKVRRVGQRLSEAQAQQKMRKINKKRKTKMSKEEKQIRSFNLTITNIGQEKISLEQIMELYRARWQIESPFKILKSTFAIDKMNAGKVEYIETLIYARIIGLLITLPMYKVINEIGIQEKAIGVSIQRFYKIVISNKEVITKVGMMTVKMRNTMEQFLKDILKLSLHEKGNCKIPIQLVKDYLT